MTAYTVHTYTTNSVKGIILDDKDSTPDHELIRGWLDTPEGKETLGWCEPERLFLVKHPVFNFS